MWISCNNLTIVSCYLTPSDNRPEFEEKLTAIEDNFRDMIDAFKVVADINSKATDWGCSAEKFARKASAKDFDGKKCGWNTKIQVNYHLYCPLIRRNGQQT